MSRKTDLPRSGRRRVLRWLAAAPGALVLGRGLGGCGGNGGEGGDPTGEGFGPAGGRDDGSPGADSGARDAGHRTGGGTEGGGADAGGRTDAGADGAVDCEPASADALGPFYEEGAPMRTRLADEDEPGEPLRIEGRLLDAADCRTPLGGYGLDLWQANRDGEYYEPPDYRLRGRLVTKDDGSFAFETIAPGNYRLGGGFRPAHIHIRVYAPSGAQLLTSQLYFEGDPYLGEDDACQPPNCFSNDPDRIIRLTDATIGGREGKMGMIPLFVAAERG